MLRISLGLEIVVVSPDRGIRFHKFFGRLPLRPDLGASRWLEYALARRVGIAAR